MFISKIDPYLLSFFNINIHNICSYVEILYFAILSFPPRAVVVYCTRCVRRRWARRTTRSWTKRSWGWCPRTSTTGARGAGYTALTSPVLGAKSNLFDTWLSRLVLKTKRALGTIVWPVDGDAQELHPRPVQTVPLHPGVGGPHHLQVSCSLLLPLARYDGSPQLAKVLEGYSRETHPHLYTLHCWDVRQQHPPTNTINAASPAPNSSLSRSRTAAVWGRQSSTCVSCKAPQSTFT